MGLEKEAKLGVLSFAKKCVVDSGLALMNGFCCSSFCFFHTTWHRSWFILHGRTSLAFGCSSLMLELKPPFMQGEVGTCAKPFCITTSLTRLCIHQLILIYPSFGATHKQYCSCTLTDVRARMLNGNDTVFHVLPLQCRGGLRFCLLPCLDCLKSPR
jgi:hypothetical protein